MDIDQAWQAIDAQRSRVADLLEDLSEQEWKQPSLCEGWTVRDVAAHLTLQQLGVRDVLRTMVTMSPRGMNAVIFESARRRAAIPTGEMIGAIRGMIGSRRHNIGVTHRETLIDALVHGQDIAVPLGRQLPIPVDAATAAADRVWARGWPWHAGRRLAGFRISATDTSWAVGDGAPVEGPIGAILLLLTERPVALPLLSQGADAVRSRLAASR